MRLIVNADDFGFTRGVNFGIIEGHEHGVITSTTALVNMPAIEHAAQLAKDHPHLGIGLHLNLTLGKPLTSGPTLIQANGDFVDKNQRFILPLAVDEAEIELRAQLARFDELFGSLPSHLDSHHSIHDHPLIWPITQKLSKEYHLKVRRYNHFRWRSDFFEPHNTVNDLLVILNEMQCDMELMVHPGYCDPQLLNASSYNIQRVKELSTLCDDKVLDAIRHLGIQLTNYHESREEAE